MKVFIVKHSTIEDDGEHESIFGGAWSTKDAADNMCDLVKQAFTGDDAWVEELDLDNNGLSNELVKIIKNKGK